MKIVNNIAVKLAMVGVASGSVALVGLWPDWSRALQKEGYYTEPRNGDFESGYLFPWYGSGDVGVASVNVLDGSWSAFITTAGWWDSLSGTPAVGDVCSHLISPPVYPPFESGKTEVYFKVRYKTDEAVGAGAFYVDPFHATLKTPQGSVDLVTISADGIFWSEDGAVETEVLDESTSKELDAPPQLPPFEPRYDRLFDIETPTLDVFTELPLEGCAPVQIRFQICDWLDAAVDSGAFIDEVLIEFHSRGRPRPCGILATPVVAWPPAPRQ
jgi:hypothetical protein